MKNYSRNSLLPFSNDSGNDSLKAVFDAFNFVESLKKLRTHH